jgi:hypothetical protein
LDSTLKVTSYCCIAKATIPCDSEEGKAGWLVRHEKVMLDHHQRGGRFKKPRRREG